MDASVFVLDKRVCEGARLRAASLFFFLFPSIFCEIHHLVIYFPSHLLQGIVWENIKIALFCTWCTILRRWITGVAAAYSPGISNRCYIVFPGSGWGIWVNKPVNALTALLNSAWDGARKTYFVLWGRRHFEELSGWSDKGFSVCGNFVVELRITPGLTWLSVSKPRRRWEQRLIARHRVPMYGGGGLLHNTNYKRKAGFAI